MRVQLHARGAVPMRGAVALVKHWRRNVVLGKIHVHVCSLVAEHAGGNMGGVAATAHCHLAGRRSAGWGKGAGERGEKRMRECECVCVCVCVSA